LEFIMQGEKGGQVSHWMIVKSHKKKLLRRVTGDRSQHLRRGVQFAFVALNLWIGTDFLRWVHQFESGGSQVIITRPAGVEGWLPIASLMNLKIWLATGHVPAIHPAGIFLLLAFVGMSLLLRKAFCGWVCPVGTLSEYSWKLGRHIFGQNWILPRWADIPLRGLKYLLLGFFIWVVVSMGAPELKAFLASPYGLVADVKMLNFFRFLTVTGAIVIGLLLTLSVVIRNFWCRYLCPYGALMGLFALLSPTRIGREPEPCIDCAKCAKACPAQLPVDQLITIRSAECLGCMECVAVCPAEGALALSIGRRTRLSGWAMAAGVVAIFVTVAGLARWTGHWESAIPDQAYTELVPHAAEFDHPR
jgi:polyferredoxin